MVESVFSVNKVPVQSLALQKQKKKIKTERNKKQTNPKRKKNDSLELIEEITKIDCTLAGYR